jgi:hypothetical protein
VVIRVVNKRDGVPGEYVGRPSPLGNQFKIGPDGTREEVINLYRIWLWNEISFTANPPAAAREINRLYRKWQLEGDLTLVCWCAPQACHADVIKRCLEWKAEEQHELPRAKEWLP